MEPLKQLGAFVGWLSGSLAGVTAILYGAGFIASLAQFRLLGLEFDFASHDAFDYIARGGNVIPRAFFGLIVPATLVMAIAGGWGKVAAWWRRRRAGESEAGSVAPSFWGTFALLLATALVSIIGLGRALYPGLEVSGLLFTEIAALCTGGESDLARAIIRQDRAELDKAFFAVTFTAGIAISLGWIGARRVRRQGGRRILLLLFVAVALVPVIAVPIAHGLYGLRTELPPVTLAADTALLPTQSPTLETPPRLLLHGSGGTLLWLPGTREVLWLRAGTFDALRVGAPLALFANADEACPASKDEPE